MRPFNEAQLAIVQAEIDRNYSFNYPKIDVSEDKMRDIVVKALGIDPATVRTKANFLFYDCRTPEIGLEFKKRLFKNPETMFGKEIEFTMTRTIDGVPTHCPDAAIKHICDAYAESIDEFNADCGGNVWFAGALYSEDTLVYYHEQVEKLDASTLTGEWRKGSRKTENNLYVQSKATGRHLFTYLSNGQKLQIKLQVPAREDTHVVKATRAYRFPEVEASLVEAAEAMGIDVTAYISTALNKVIHV